MRTGLAASYKPSLLWALAGIVVALTACSARAPTRVVERTMLPIASPSSTPTGTPVFHPVATEVTLTNTPTLFSTAIIEATATPAVTTPPLGGAIVEAFQIESGSDKYVEKATWSDNNQLLYVFSVHGNEGLNWAVYDTEAHVTTVVSSPLKYDSHIWQQLSGPNPRDDPLFCQELWGCISPSGKRVIYTVTYSNPFSTPYPFARTEVWVADSTNRRKTKLSFRADMGSIYRAAWFKDEVKVIFDFRYEGDGTDLQIADVRDGTVVSLADVSDFKARVLEWALSPDGATLAVTDLKCNLWLVSLENGKSRGLEKCAVRPYWSKDGKRLYYTWGSSFEDMEALRVYDITSGDISTLVSRSSLERLRVPFRDSDFAVSPGGDKIVFWGGWLWLVELRK